MYSWIPITQTLANSNLTLIRTKFNFLMDFLCKFTVILPLETRALNNLSLQLSWSNFCFPTDYYYLLYWHECFTGEYTTGKIHKNYIWDPSG